MIQRMSQAKKKNALFTFVHLFTSKWIKLKDLNKIEKCHISSLSCIAVNAQFLDSNWPKALLKISLSSQIFNA